MIDWKIESVIFFPREGPGAMPRSPSAFSDPSAAELSEAFPRPTYSILYLKNLSSYKQQQCVILLTVLGRV